LIRIIHPDVNPVTSSQNFPDVGSFFIAYTALGFPVIKTSRYVDKILKGASSTKVAFVASVLL
jgi:hypothetical protein